MRDTALDDGDRADDDRPLLAAAYVTYEDAPNELTLYPARVQPAELTSQWITARDGSFVDLDEWR